MQRENNLQVAKNILRDFNGRHHPLFYRQEYNFSETWETVGVNSNIDQKYYSWKNDNKTTTIAQLILAVFYIIVLWFMSTYRSLQIDGLSTYFILIAMLTQISDIVIEEISSKE